MAKIHAFFMCNAQFSALLGVPLQSKIQYAPPIQISAKTTSLHFAALFCLSTKRKRRCEVNLRKECGNAAIKIKGSGR